LWAVRSTREYPGNISKIVVKAEESQRDIEDTLNGIGKLNEPAPAIASAAQHKAAPRCETPLANLIQGSIRNMTNEIPAEGKVAALSVSALALQFDCIYPWFLNVSLR
jgi:hypothetical protein